MNESAREQSGQHLGRYHIGDEVAAGGMATVHLGRVLGPAGLSRVVAIKRMHAHVARDPVARRMFLDEARLAYRISHPNVVGTLDVVEHEDQILIVLEYVAGETLAKLLEPMIQAGQLINPAALSAIVIDALHGLHAAHEVKDDQGVPVNVIHRDVSPQNLIVGVDGVTRVLDFGIAKAQGRLQETTGVALRGKLRYLSPEQIRRAPIDRRVDLFAAGVVLWESLTGRRLFDADDIAGVLDAVLHEPVPDPSSVVAGLPPGLGELILRALSRDPAGRPATALAFAEELQEIVAPAPVAEVARLVAHWAAPALEHRRRLVARLSTPIRVVALAGRPAVARAPHDGDADRTEADASGSEHDVPLPALKNSGPDAVTASLLAQPAPLRSRSRWWFAAPPVIVLVALVSKLLGRADPRPAEPPVRARFAAEASPQPRPPDAQPLPSAATAATAATATATIAIAIAVPGAAGPSKPVSMKRSGPRPFVAPPVASPRTPSSVNSGCDFPFTIGEGGVRIPKKSCFPK